MQDATTTRGEHKKIMSTLQWENVPHAVTDQIAGKTGPIIKAAPASDGKMIPGLTAILHGADGRRWFLKASPKDSPAAFLYQREMAANSLLPETIPAPRMEWASGENDWIAMLFEYMDGRGADLTPLSPDVPSVMSTIAVLSSHTATHILPPVAVHIRGLQEKAGRLIDCLPASETREIRAAIEEFDTLDLAGKWYVHYDMHRGNLRVRPMGMVAVVDLAYACAGAQWLDAASIVPRLIQAGHSPADAERAVSVLPAWSTAPAEAVTGYAALWTAFRQYKAIYGPTNAHHARARAAEAGLAWISYRMRR